MNPEIIQKYNIPVPRYTSYPPANYFKPFTNEEYLETVRHSNTINDSHLSFYLHIPFCHHLCHYCGCNSYPIMGTKMIERYINALHKEIDLLLPSLRENRLISQIHYGGGSPTAVPIHFIKELNDHLLSAFRTIPSPEIAIECHPGYLTSKDWQELTSCGFTRFSIGVQDFENKVLKLVHRRPSLLPMDEIFLLLRERGATINLDFLYGLPGQSPISFGKTIERATTLLPDRLVTFSYAHVPWVNKRQLILEKAGLPKSEEKNQMFNQAASILRNAGYNSIGLDHFVLPGDELNKALKAKQLHRNFQGYCTRRTTGQVYAFGVTGISQLNAAYAQNGKDICRYIETIEQGKLYIEKGYLLNNRERIIREIIESLMCNYYIDWKELAQKLRLSVEEIKSTIIYDEKILTELACDGLIKFSSDYLYMSEINSPFVRNVAASIDPFTQNTNLSFSKPI